ncbi:hypothetical protein QQ045_020066 [Rhodiola kirilowii]
MPTPTDATPDYDHKQSATTTSAGSPCPNPTTVAAAAAAMHANNGSNIINQNQRSETSRDSIIQLLDSVDMMKLVHNLHDAEKRPEALEILSKLANNRPAKTLELAPMLWNTPGIIYILLQEVVPAYRCMNNEDKLQLISPRALNAMCLFQSLAMQPSFKRPFVAAQIPIYLYPFLRRKETTPTIEKFRLAAMGTIGALVKMSDPEVIHYLLDSQVFPCCLCSLEFGHQLAKSVAAYVMYKLLSSEFGILYCCNFSERFLSVVQVLLKVVEQTSEINAVTIRTLKYVVGSYLVLAEFPRACEYLKFYFPTRFCSGRFLALLQNVDPRLYEDLKKLCDKIDAEMIRLRQPLLALRF